jgi:antitoxin component HigA of HigAB toxin-antitoxin module
MKYFNLRPLQSDEEFYEAVDLIDTLLDLEPLDQTEDEFLNELSDLVWEYENHPMLGADE